MNGKGKPTPIQLATALAETYFLAELVWYTIHDGDQKLYEFILEQVPRFRDWVVYQMEVRDTLRFIRRLPEQ